MGTRATYNIKKDTFSTCLYIHWDGYPEGAAAYFYKALQATGKGFAEQMIIANNAEITRHRDQHGDTEFHYEIDKADGWLTLRAFAKNWNADEWKPIYAGSLYSFINDNQTEYLGEDFTPFKLVTSRYNQKSWHNLKTAQLKLAEPYSCLAHLRAWSDPEKHNRASANYQGQLEELAIWVETFPELASAETTEMLKDRHPIQLGA